MPLEECLKRLERSLLTPLISGELETWAQSAHEAFVVAEAVIRGTVARHAGEIDQIQADDPDLGTEVEKLRAADAEILKATDRLRDRFDLLIGVAPKIEPAEAPGSALAEKLSEEGIELILEVRRQEEALKTWQYESIARDRGEGD